MSGSSKDPGGLRIAYVYAGNAQVFAASGGSVHMQEVMRALVARGAEVNLLARRVAGKRLPGLQAVRTHRLDRRAEAPAARARLREATNSELRARLAELGPVDLVYERFSLGSYAAMEHAREVGVPGVLEVNGPRIEKAAARGALADRAGAEAAAARAVDAATAVFAVSEGVARYVRERFGPHTSVQVVPNGVDPGRFPASLIEHRNGGARPFTVGFTGTFKAHHGLDTLVEAFVLLRRVRPDAELLLVGEGRERATVESRLSDLELADAARLTGEVPPRQVPELLAQMDVGVAPFPPRRSYVSPLKVFEYMAAGLPVVASGVEQVADLIAHGATGLLFDAEDSAGMAAALEALSNDPELRTRLGSAGRRRVMEQYTWDAVADRILGLLTREREGR